MARTTATNFSGGLQFPYATAATDVFHKEDIQTLAQAVDQHDHTAGKGHSINTVPANASITNAMLGSDVARANLLTNGSFEIWQRGNGPFTATNAFTSDRWQIVLVASDTLSVSRDNPNEDASGGGLYCAACTFTLSGGAGSSVLAQTLKSSDGNQLLGRTVTQSVRVRTSTANAVRIGIYNGSAYTYSSFHTGGGAYETLTVTATITAGAATVFAAVAFAASCTAYIDNAMLVVGSQAADYAPLHPADDLARCLRYYETFTRTNGQAFSTGGYAFSTTQATFLYFWKAIKAVMPTITLSGAAAFAVAGGAGNSNGTAITATVQGTEMSPITITGAIAVAAVGGNTVLNAAAAATATIVVEANP